VCPVVIGRFSREGVPEGDDATPRSEIFVKIAAPERHPLCRMPGSSRIRKGAGAGRNVSYLVIDVRRIAAARFEIELFGNRVYSYRAHRVERVVGSGNIPALIPEPCRG